MHMLYMILIYVIPFTESLTTGPGHVICIKGYVILICLTLFTESLTKGPGHVMCISMYMYMYLNYDLISTTLLRKRKRIDDFSQSYWFCGVSIFLFGYDSLFCISCLTYSVHFSY